MSGKQNNDRKRRTANALKWVIFINLALKRVIKQ